MPKLPKDLRDPIEVQPPSLALNEDELKTYCDNRFAFVLTERLRKLDTLMTALKVPDAHPTFRLLWTCLELAQKSYPGFRTTDLDGVRRQGRKRRSGLFADPATTLALIDVLKREGFVKNDKDACRWLIQAEDEGLLKSNRRTELESKVRTSASVVSRARKAGGRANKAAG
jgi:hypothetical protein